MSNLLGILINGIAQLEYDRDRPLPDHQAVYLEKMDEKMKQGIEFGNEIIENPDINQRAQFVAANLLNALQTGNEEMSAALCTWLAPRLPDLKQVKYAEDGEQVSIDLVYDEDYGKQAAVTFSKLN